MASGQDDHLPFRRNQWLRAPERGFEQRVVAKEFHVLFGQRIAAQSLDEGSESDAVSAREYHRATMLRSVCVE
jgi:hypothetical protein